MLGSRELEEARGKFFGGEGKKRSLLFRGAERENGGGWGVQMEGWDLGKGGYSLGGRLEFSKFGVITYVPLAFVLLIGPCAVVWLDKVGCCGGFLGIEK